MVFKEETKSKGWLSWRESPRAGAVLDVEEVPSNSDKALSGLLITSRPLTEGPAPIRGATPVR